MRIRIHNTRSNYKKGEINNIGVLGNSMIPDGLFLRLVG
jgi:hypothetical protein